VGTRLTTEYSSLRHVIINAGAVKREFDAAAVDTVAGGGAGKHDILEIVKVSNCSILTWGLLKPDNSSA